MHTTRHRPRRSDLDVLVPCEVVALPCGGTPVVGWSVAAVRATFLRDGELVPPLSWAASGAGDAHHLAAAAELAARSRAQGTRRAYGRHVDRWLTWAEKHGECPVPAEPRAVQAFLLQEVLLYDEDGVPLRDGDGLLRGRVVMGTVAQAQAALTRLHRLADQPSPFDAPQLKTLLAGMRRTLTTAPLRAKAALTWDLLEQMLDVPVRGASPRALRGEAARALHRSTGATAGQLARVLWSDFTITDSAVVVILPPGRRGASPTRHELRVGAQDHEAATAVRRWQAASQAWPGTAMFRDSTGKALTRQGLHRILSTAGTPRCDGAPNSSPVRLAEVRDRALLLGGWISALRRSNLARLTWSDMTRDESGWTAYIRTSKTDQEGHGATVAIPTAPPDSGIADPALAVDDWLAVTTAVLGIDPRRMKDVPVFTHIDQHDNLVVSADGMPVGLSGAGINDIVQRAARAAHLDQRVHLTHGGRPTAAGASPFGAHSRLIAIEGVVGV